MENKLTLNSSSDIEAIYSINRI